MRVMAVFIVLFSSFLALKLIGTKGRSEVWRAVGTAWGSAALALLVVFIVLMMAFNWNGRLI